MMSPHALETPARRAIVRRPHEGIVYQPASGDQAVKVSGVETGGAFEVIEIEAVPGAGPPLHVHREFDAAFVVTEGALALRIGERTVDLRARGAALVPAGTAHTWKNRGAKIARFLQITAPGAMAPLLADLAARPRATPEEVARLADARGTTIVGPPL